MAMGYDELHVSAFEPNPSESDYTECWQVFTLPGEWKAAILEALARARRKQDRAYLPIRAFNRVISAVVPDVLHVASNADDLDKPWLYARNALPENVMTRLVAAWMRYFGASYDLKPVELRDLFGVLDVGGSAVWEPAVVDLWENNPTAGGTAGPHQRLFWLLPDTLARTIASASAEHPYDPGGQAITFRQVVTDEGAELVSWPPSKHGGFHFSAVIWIRLHTEPFSPVPRVNLRVGLKRWKRSPSKGRIHIPDRKSIGVYLKPHSPWIEDTPVPERLSRVSLRRGRDGEIVWSYGEPAGMLAELGTTGMPDPAKLCADPDSWIKTAGVVHHTTHGRHGVQLGISPTETMDIMEWVASFLEPKYRRVEPLRLVPGALKPRFQVPKVLKNVTEVVPPTPPETDDPAEREIYRMALEAAEKKQAVNLKNKQKAAADAETAVNAWRELLSHATDCDEVAVHLLYRTPEVRERIVEAARSCLDVSEVHIEEDAALGRQVIYLDAETVAVRITADRLGGLDEPMLIDGHTPYGRKQYEQAKAERAERTRAYLTELAVDAELLVVELPDKDFYAGERNRSITTDPKQAIRVGAGRAGYVVQCITGKPSGEKEDVDSLPDRARAAWEDGLRAVGVRFIPEHTVGDAIPKDLEQLAFWLVKRNRTGRTRPAFTPVAVLIRPGERRIMAKLPDGPWRPYPDILREVTELKPLPAGTNTWEQKKTVGRFVEDVLLELRTRQLLVLVSANNARQRWDGILNPRLLADQIGYGISVSKTLAKLNPRARVVRLRNSGSDRVETPQWWAPDPKTFDERTKRITEAGYSSGLWRHESSSDRVFYSTAEKNDRLNSHKRTLRKLTESVSAAGKPVRAQAGKTMPRPELVEIAVLGMVAGDNPRDWAVFTHQQRFVSEYRIGLAWPLALKLAADIGDYAQSGADEEAEDAETAPAEEEPEQPGLFGLEDLG
ncbi:pPIWI_RE module domain-containing protein [Phytomonospora endophytica]|uniref:DUF3893 domain-containing protein n=1 Tax=Phytomonospora endophytica TaxID=714109 RepID=A0A841FIH3_9ACTN|nr:DUF3962 domain-containing protein [Phytomonospora endophytica]MBB6032937.1 hypothetical protein [Phytomonospora endophytica]GIG65163.1 hypothetical protein Pen01_14580 [Phytomonospora endophytica]